MRLLLFPILALLSSQCLAQGYLGLGLGQLDYEETDDALGFTLEDQTSAYKLYGGMRVGDDWAIEAYYGVTDDLSWSESGFVPGFGNTAVTLSGDYEIIEVRGLARVAWFLVGIGYWDADLDARFVGTSDFTGPFNLSASESDSGASLIVGAEWDVDTWSVRAEYEWLDTDDSIDAAVLGVGAHFRF